MEETKVEILQIIEALLTLVGAATVLLQAIPQVDKNSKLKPVLQFIGRYIALNKQLFYK
jgi:hypothetical protein